MLNPILASVLLLSLTMIAQGTPRAATVPMRVAGVQVKGAVRYLPEEVARLSGLTVGQSATIDDLTAVANKLASTGLFETVRYAYTTTGTQMAVTFEIEEAPWDMEMILDNFVWFSDEQLVAAVKKEVPSFDGLRAPTKAGAADFIAGALQKVLRSKELPGVVVASTQTDLRTSVTKYLFAVKDPAPKVCSLRVQGTTAIAERDLIERVAGLVGGEYSRFLTTGTANGTLLDMYRHRGFLRAAFGPPAVSLEACDGVAVTLNVTEGPAFSWDQAEWTGNESLTASQLDAALGMKKGQPADTSRIDQGLRDVHSHYEIRGYMLQGTRQEMRLDDGSRTAVFRFAVTEGPQFRMGTLQFDRLSEKDAGMLRSKWPLKTGEVFDRSRATKYEIEVLSPLRTTDGRRARLYMDLDRTAHVVNVRVAFE